MRPSAAPPPRIVLLGLRGAGKTAVARELARRLGVPAIDVDALVAARAGKPVARVFAEEGEARFRDLEAAALREALVATEAGGVVSPGGGALLRPESRLAIARSGVHAVYLRARPETLAARVGAQVTLVTKKGPRGESANAAEPCAPDVFERVLKEADLVITGAADCGSCTAYSVVDAIALEKAGVPAVVVTTTKFRPIAETLSEQFGLKETRLLVLPHPIGGTEREMLYRWADEGVERVIAVVTTAAE